MNRITQILNNASQTSKVLEFIRVLGFTNGQEIWLNARCESKSGKQYSRIFTGIFQPDTIELWEANKAGEDNNGDTIWIRGQKINNAVAFLRELGRQHWDVSFYPNHFKGGISKNHASKFTTCFFEIDNVSIEEQEAQLKYLQEKLGLTASVTVFTGGKSLHNYFALSEPVDKETWVRINRKLTAIVRGDTAIPNPARGMRLPGIIRYIEKLGEYREVEIIRSSPASYNSQEFEAALDSTGLFPYGVDDERWRQWTKNKCQDFNIFTNPPAPPRERKPLYIDPASYTDVTIPLEICLSRHDRDLIAGGSGKGNRDNDGYKLARAILGTAEWFVSNGVYCTDDPLSLFEEYARKCDPPLSGYDVTRIWRSAGRGNPTPSLPDDAMQNCIGAYLWREKSLLSKGDIGNKKKIARVIKKELPQTEEIAKKEPTYKLPAGLTKIWEHLRREDGRHSRRYLRKATPTPTVNKPSANNYQASIPQSSAIVPTFAGISIYEHPDFAISKLGKRVFVYQPGNLPTPERLQYLGNPTISFEKKYRRTLNAEARAKGYSNIKDESGTGSGKSYDLGFISLKDYPGMSRVLYLSDDAENPTTGSVETNFERFVTRHDGQKYDYSHSTPTGQPYKRRIKPGESADIPGNCPETQTFLKFNEKGLSIGGGKDSPICQACPLLSSCEFLSMRKRQIQHSELLRAHPDQITSELKGSKETIAIWDEPGKILKTNQLISFSWNEILKPLATIGQKDPELHNALVLLLGDWFTKLSLTKIDPKYGISFLELQKLLSVPTMITLPAGNGNYRKVSTLMVARAADKSLNPSLNFSGTQTPAQKQEWIDSEWHPHYFTLLVESLTGHNPQSAVSLTLDKNENWNFTVALPYNRHKKTAGVMGLNIWLDATMSLDDLSTATGISKNKFLVVEENQADYSNLTIKIVGGVGSCGMNRDTEGIYSQHQRIKHFITAVARQNPGSTAVIDFKKFMGDMPEGEDLLAGYWYVDNRGSNAFIDAKQLIAIGSPLPNLGALAMEYQAITGKTTTPTDFSGEFGEWVQRKSTAEIIQLVGRLRAQRTTENKTCWMVSDSYPTNITNDLQRAYPGCKIEFVDVADVCVAAATKGTQRIHAMIAAMYDLLKSGMECTTSAVAKLAGLASRSRVSQLAGIFGGFDSLKEVLIFLVDAFKGKLTPPQLPETLRLFAEKYLPGELQRLAQNQEPEPILDGSPPDVDEGLEWTLEVITTFACRPWECASSVASFIENLGTKYFALVWGRLGVWERRFLRAFGPNICRQAS